MFFQLKLPIPSGAKSKGILMRMKLKILGTVNGSATPSYQIDRYINDNVDQGSHDYAYNSVNDGCFALFGIVLVGAGRDIKISAVDQ